ncbi:MAG: isopentenyl-diphosphate Delta-isomerase [Gammaproteobacteria bacterium]|nr:isopentenyl-diphosphate Delta-isomerase [Gammaproteobacteria bacterium]
MSEYVILVDDNDQAIGRQEKLKAHERAQRHRAFSVFIYRFNPQPEILLQQRHPDKYHCGGLWTNTCCGHPRPSEDIQRAASRRLFEEMGISTELKKVGTFTYIAHFENGLTENEIDHVFIGNIRNSPLSPNPEEVIDHAWISIQHLVECIDKNPEKFTPWLKSALEFVSRAL